MKERRKRLLQNIYLREKNLDTNLPKILEPNQSGLDSSNQDYSLDFQKDYETKIRAVNKNIGQCTPIKESARKFKIRMRLNSGTDSDSSGSTISQCSSLGNKSDDSKSEILKTDNSFKITKDEPLFHFIHGTFSL